MPKIITSSWSNPTVDIITMIKDFKNYLITGGVSYYDFRPQPYNWLELERIKILTKKYPKHFINQKNKSRIFTATFKTKDPKYQKLINFDFNCEYYSIKRVIRDFKDYFKSELTFRVSFNFACFADHSLDNPPVADHMLDFALINFEHLEDKQGKLHVDRMIWNKEQRQFYPVWVILDSDFNVYNIYDYI